MFNKLENDNVNNICSFLSDNDLCQMRLVSKKYEKNVYDVFVDRLPKKTEVIANSISNIIKDYSQKKTGQLNGLTATVIESIESYDLKIKRVNTVDDSLKKYNRHCDFLYKKSSEDEKIFIKNQYFIPKVLTKDLINIKKRVEGEKQLQNVQIATKITKNITSNFFGFN